MFFGLKTMSDAAKFETIRNGISAFFGVEAFSYFPPLLVLIGALVTALLQSSSASIGITVAMVASGALQFHSAIYVVLGATIGTVITLLIATIGGDVKVKRTGVIVLIIRVIAALLALAIYWPLAQYIDTALLTMFGNNASLAAAMFHVFYNIIFMLAALPFVGLLEKLSIKLIRDKDEEKKREALKYIDNHLLNTPTIALMQVKREIMNMMSLAHDNLKRGFERILEQDPSNDKEIIETEDKIDYINNQITAFLIELTHTASLKDEKTIGSFFHVVNDIERIGDHAYNFYDSSLKMVANDLKFSDTAKKEFREMFAIVDEMFELSFVIFHDQTGTYLKKLHDLENQTDNLKNKLSSAHYERIQKNMCKMENSPFYTSLVSELERVADHLVNVGYSIDSPVGDDEYEVKQA